MDAELETNLLTILTACATLRDADLKLKGLLPVPTRAWRWGLWDGWRELPLSTSGLVSQSMIGKSKAEADYERGYGVGRTLRGKRVAVPSESR